MGRTAILVAIVGLAVTTGTRNLPLLSRLNSSDLLLSLRLVLVAAR